MLRNENPHQLEVECIVITIITAFSSDLKILLSENIRGLGVSWKTARCTAADCKMAAFATEISSQNKQYFHGSVEPEKQGSII